MCTQPRDQPAADQGAQGEGAQRGQGGWDGEAGGTCQREPQEHDVAGHVGDEHVPEHQIAEGVDETGHDGQGEEQGRKGSVRVVGGRHHRPPRVHQWCGHVCPLSRVAR